MRSVRHPHKNYMRSLSTGLTHMISFLFILQEPRDVFMNISSGEGGSLRVQIQQEISKFLVFNNFYGKIGREYRLG